MKKKLLLLCCFLFISIINPLFAEIDDEGPDAPPDPVPIDFYIPMLVVAGAVIGYRKLNSKNKFINFK